MIGFQNKNFVQKQLLMKTENDWISKQEFCVEVVAMKKE